MLDSVIILTISILLTMYALMHYFVWKGLSRWKHSEPGPEQSISVIIAARNEENNIGACLEALTKQHYPTDTFEVIVVDDRSGDTTSSVVREYTLKYPNIVLETITENRSDMPNKKNALTHGIKRARFPILAFTDADCTAPPTWLRSISNAYGSDVGAVAGYSPNAISGYSFFARIFLHYEELKNSILAAAGVGLQKAFMCTGRNFSYRRSVYEELGGFEKIKQSVSGDDDLFLQRIQEETHWEIRYIPDADNAVLTNPPSSFSEFLHQRVRHISASQYYAAPIKAYYAVGHLLTVAALAGLFFSPLTALILLMVKINIDGIIVAKGKELFRDEVSIVEFFLGEIMIILYSFLIAPFAFLFRFNWKEQTVS